MSTTSNPVTLVAGDLVEARERDPGCPGYVRVVGVLKGIAFDPMLGVLLTLRWSPDDPPAQVSLRRVTARLALPGTDRCVCHREMPKFGTPEFHAAVERMLRDLDAPGGSS